MAHVHGKRLGNRRAALWWLGWHPLAAVLVGGLAGLAFGNAVAVPVGLLIGVNVVVTMIVGTVGGMVVGGLAWHRGTVTVNRDYVDVVESMSVGDRQSGDETFVLLGEGTGTQPLVDPRQRYDATVLRLDDDAVNVYSGAFDLAERQPRLDGDAMVLPYARVEAVEYDGDLRIETVRGDCFAYATSSEPDELIRSLRRHIG